jgi:uncharacterized protein YegJ (DUF2314 family)
MSEPVFRYNSDDAMLDAAIAAQRSFKYFWRELSWERRRMIPALDSAAIKLPFTDGPRSDGNGEFEMMWVNEINFDGITLTGTLVNSPNYLTSVQQGYSVTSHFSYLYDWMMTRSGKAYGGYTVNLIRSRMNADERAAHDKAWGVDFGDPSQIRIDFRDSNKGAASAGVQGAFSDHPMCVNMIPQYDAQMQSDPGIATAIDEGGWTLLQREALAGNLGMVKLLVRHGADIAARTPDGRDAATLAQGIGWDEIATYLSNPAGAG